MPYIFWTLSLLFYPFENDMTPPPFDFDAAWKKVEEFRAQGQPKSALAEVEIILQAAKAEDVPVQLVKSVKVKSELILETVENGMATSLTFITKEAEQAKVPARQVLFSYLAELYEGYLSQNRYTIAQRTTTLDENDDFQTWDSQRFHKTILQYYTESLRGNTWNSPVSDWAPLLVKQENQHEELRPVLYFLLWDRLYAYLNSSRGQVQLSLSGTYTIKDKMFFGSEEEMQNISLRDIEFDNDPLYLILQSYIYILQQGRIQSSLAKANYYLNYLKFIHDNSQIQDKDSLYITSLESYIDNYKQSPYVTMAYYEIGNQYVQKGEPETALQWFTEGAALFPDSPGWVSCRHGIAEIEQKEVNLNTEEVFAKNENPRFALDYKNVDKVSVHVYKIENKNLKVQKHEPNERYTILMQGAVKVYEKTWNLPTQMKYKTNLIEGELPKMDYGTYILEIRGLKGTELQSLHNYAIFHVSDLAAISWREGNVLYYKVTDRISGKPIKKANVSLKFTEYNYQEKTDVVLSEMTKKTDKNGVVSFTIQNQRRVAIILQHGDDILDTHSYRYFNKENKQDKTRYFAEVFTDRPIYRPGHVVHFKAIAIKTEKDAEYEVIPDTDVEVSLIDANYQVVEKKSCKTNAFGSVAGSFVLPGGKLTGDVHIQVQNKKGVFGQKYFKVEEYKRPSFEIIPDSFKQSYALHKEVVTGGKVINYAGNAVDGATIQFNVVRGVRYIDWGWWWRPGPQHRGSEVVMAHGQTVTDADGRYTVTFEAVPDESADKQDWTVFDYRVEIVALDQTGESQEVNSEISIGYKSETLETNLPASFDLGDGTPFQVIKKNLQGAIIEGEGTLVIEKLKEPDSIIPSSYWNVQGRDKLRYEADKIQILPVPQPRRFDTWPVLKKIVEQRFSTNDEISTSVFPGSGVYKITLHAKDVFGEVISQHFYHEVSDFEEKQFPRVEPLFLTFSNKTIEPGKTLEVKLGAVEEPVYVTVMVENREGVVFKENFKVNNTLQFQYPVQEKDRGGLFVHVFYVYKNRRFEVRTQIVVPYTNKQLQIELETFRDKLVPGAMETYSFVVKGMEKDAVLAELMTTMYDASLESFVKNNWESNWYHQFYSRLYYDVIGFQMVGNMVINSHWNEQKYIGLGYYNLPSLEGIYSYYQTTYYDYDSYNERTVLARSKRTEIADAAPMAMESAREESGNEPVVEVLEPEKEKIKPALRKNLNELVFFYPQLQTDAQGNVKFTFTMNEALTRWKIMSLAHTPDLKAGYNEWFVQSQKKVMVFPNAPRFVRNGDEILFTAKVVNQENESLPVDVDMKLTETLTGKDVTSLFIQSAVSHTSTLPAKASRGFTWKLVIPDDFIGNLTWTVWANAGEHSDGEENVIPVLTNRQLITETMPIYTLGHQEKSMVFNAFAKKNSTTRKDHLFTVEYTSHPIWYAIQALPYLTEQGYETTEQIINRYFANALAAKIANSHPKIKAVFDQWKTAEPDVLTSKLLANPELKSALLEETPWVMQSIQEESQKRNIALLFENNQLSQELKQSLRKLAERQLPNGGFPWCTNGRADLYISQYILESVGQMKNLGIIDVADPEISSLISRTFQFVDKETLELYRKNKSDKYSRQGVLYPLNIHYLYLRTLFPNQALPEGNKDMVDDFMSMMKKDWLKQNIYSQAIIGLIMQAKGDPLAKQILISLEERSFSTEELGTYWNVGNGYRWDELPIERQAKIIEFYAAMQVPAEKMIPLKIWLLKNKQSRHWPTSKSTAAAIYGLLAEGESGEITHWVEEVKPVSVFMDGDKIDFGAKAAGTGYMKKSWRDMTYPKSWANLTINNPNSSVSWGAVYYQYFEEIQKVAAVRDNPLKITKQMMVLTQTDEGEKVSEIRENTPLKPGDRLVIKLRIQSDRSMDYVHLKDGRPAGTEPMETLSGYRYKGGLGYYENSKDLATHFFIQHLPKGDFIIEYRVKIVHEGLYSAGLATLQSMYAPEFSSHSQGFLLEVK